MIPKKINGIKLVIGAGEYRNNPGWVHTQEDELNLLRREQWTQRFAANSIDALLAEHVWEHLDGDEGLAAAKLCFDFLKPGGYVRCAVPDGYFPDAAYQHAVQIGGPGPADHPAASHKIVHTCDSLTAMFEQAGFDVRLLEYCDERGAFHANAWDAGDGFIYRSERFDHRNANGTLGFVSLLIDAVKPEDGGHIR